MPGKSTSQLPTLKWCPGLAVLPRRCSEHQEKPKGWRVLLMLPLSKGSCFSALGNRDDLGMKSSPFEETARLRSFHEHISNDFLKQFWHWRSGFVCMMCTKQPFPAVFLFPLWWETPCLPYSCHKDIVTKILKQAKTRCTLHFILGILRGWVPICGCYHFLQFSTSRWLFSKSHRVWTQAVCFAESLWRLHRWTPLQHLLARVMERGRSGARGGAVSVPRPSGQTPPCAQADGTPGSRGV